MENSFRVCVLLKRISVQLKRSMAYNVTSM